MKIIASSVRKGNVLEIDGKLLVVLSAESFFPGKGTPTTQIDMRRISDGVKTTARYRTTEQVERATVEEREHQFLYQDGDGFHFMNMENYDQITMQKDVIGDQAAYLHPEMKVMLSMHEGHRDRDRAAAEGHAGSHRHRADHQGADRVVVLQAGDAVERRAHQRAAVHLGRHARRGDDGGRRLRRAREGLSA